VTVPTWQVPVDGSPRDRAAGPYVESRGDGSLHLATAGLLLDRA
jgi:hypothetical protein